MARQLSRRRTAPADVQPDNDDYNERDQINEDYDPTPDESKDVGNYGRSRRRSSNRDEEETQATTRRPASRRSASRTEPSETTSVRRGWDGAKANKEKRFVSDEFKVAKEDVTFLIKFLEAEPFAVYMEHFIKALLPKRASFVCGEDGCPLCGRLGDRPSDRALFNIAVIDEKTGNATNKWWKATPSILDRIWDLAHSDRTKPIDRTDIYFEVSKKAGKNGIPVYSIDPIKARDLADDGFSPFTEDEIDDLREEIFVAEDVLKTSTKRELHEVADGLED